MKCKGKNTEDVMLDAPKSDAVYGIIGISVLSFRFIWRGDEIFIIKGY